MNGTEDPRYLLAPDLRPGEQVLWAGQGNTETWFGPSVGCAMLFGIPWLSFSVFWEYMAIAGALKSGGAAWGMVLFGIPFVAIGLGMVFGSPFADKKSRRETWFAVTTNRILIAKIGSTRTVTSLQITPELTVNKMVLKSGRGNLTFTYGVPLVERYVNGMVTNMSQQSSSENGPAIPAFMDIADPNHVEQLILAQIERKRAA